MAGLHRRISYCAALTLLASLAVPAGGPVAASPAVPPRPVPAQERPRPPRPEDPGAVPPRQVIIKFAEHATEQAKRAIRAREGLSLDDRLDLIGAEVVTLTPTASTRAVARRLANDPNVEYAEPNRPWWPASHSTSLPNDERFDRLWGLHNAGQTVDGLAGTGDVDIDAPEAWTGTEGDAGLVVAVIDTDIDITHPDLQDRIWTNPDEIPDNGIDDDGNGYVDDVHGWDFYNDDNTVFDGSDGDSHGTHVAGTIAAEVDNGIGVAGVAPNVQIMPLKFIGPDVGWTDDAIEAIRYATTMGVRISNNSWGGGEHSDALYDAIESSGQVFAAAAGNDGADIEVVDSYPAGYDLGNILSVAAVDNQGSLAPFSNYGDTSVDVGAPGVSVVSTVPEAVTALQVATDAYKAMFWGFGLEDVETRAARADVLGRALGHLGTGSEDEILLVNDDESTRGSLSHPDHGGRYRTALSDAGFTNVTPQTVTHDTSGPSASAMAGNTVVWQTGDAFGDPGASPPVTTLTATDLAELTAFLDGGGRLLLAGPDAIYGNESSSFVTSRLHLSWLREGTLGIDASGSSGGVYAGQRYALSGADNTFESPSPYRDGVWPANSRAVPALLFDGYDSYSGTSMAAPHAAGVAALVASLDPGATATAIVDRVKSTVVPLSSLEDKTSTGGMVNAANAVGVLRAPGAPTNVTAAFGDEQVSVTWRAPLKDGGSAITGYTVTAKPGGQKANVSGSARKATVTGLENGTSYTFTVKATNSVGTGPASVESNAVTPADVTAPEAVTGLTATGGLGRVSLRWTAPDDGDYEGVVVQMVRGTTPPASPSDGRRVYAGSGTKTIKKGLKPGRHYSFSVFAHDEVPNFSKRRSRVVHGTRVAISASKKAIRYGSKVRVSGRVVRAGTTKGLAGVDVQVLARKRGTSRWRRVATVTSSDTGAVSYLAKPKASTYYRLRYRGGRNRIGRTSASRRVLVRPRVTASFSDARVREGERTRLAGRVSPRHAGRKVVLQRHSGSWRNVKRTTLSSKSRYRFWIRHKRAGKYHYRVVIGGHTDHARGTSPRRTLRVR